MTKYFFFLALIAMDFQINAQSLVPNGGFEEFTECPKNFSDFIYVKEWSNLSKNSTPDLFSTCASIYSVINPKGQWCQVEPIKDSSFAGIVAFTHKSSYREYIGAELNQSLQKDSIYQIQISLAIPKLSRWSIDTLGILFTNEKIYYPYSYQTIIRPSSISFSLDSLKTDGTWFDFSMHYKASGNENYINIGNFMKKEDTELEKIDNRNAKEYRSKYDFAYLCIDNIYVTLLSDGVTKNEKPLISDKKIEKIAQDSITLRDIQFKTGSWELEQKEIPELNSLVEFLKSNPDKSIVVGGHTDNTGNVSNNQKLSLKRAERIAQYINEKGIKFDRISVVGYASERPIANNDTPEGRRMNRRVVIKIE